MNIWKMCSVAFGMFNDSFRLMKPPTKCAPFGAHHSISPVEDQFSGGGGSNPSIPLEDTPPVDPG